MNNATPARIALDYAMKKYDKPVGRTTKNLDKHNLTKQLRDELNLNWNEAVEIAADQKLWENQINTIKRE